MVRFLSFRFLFVLLSFIALSWINESIAQLDTNWVSEPDTSALYKVSRFDGHYYIGKIKRMDAREIEMDILHRGALIIPAYLVKSIEVIQENDFNQNGEYVSAESTLGQYILNSNAFSIGKGNAAVGGSLFGPDMTVGLTDKLSMRLTTTWVMTPALATIDYQIPVSSRFNAKLGLMGAWGTWNYPEGGMVLPYLGLTFGSRDRNITLTGGYGQIFSWDGPSPIWYSGFSWMNKLSPRWSVVMDTYLSGYEYTTTWVSSQNGVETRTYTEFNGMLALAARYTNNRGTFIQFGGGMVTIDEDPYPLPVIQMFHRF